jgi:hypothetical protein
MKRLAIAATGLALVVGILVGVIVGNSFGRSAPASAAGVGGRLINLGTIQIPPHTNGEYSLVDVRDCASLYGMFQAAEALSDGGLGTAWFNTSPDGTTRVGAYNVTAASPDLDGHSTLSTWSTPPAPYIQPLVFNNSQTMTANVTGWLWCATSPSYAVGGIAELPALAGTGGSGVGGATYAVIAGAAAGVLAFVALATLSAKRRTR